MEGFSFVQPPLNQQEKKVVPESENDFYKEDSLCVTEENRYEVGINPAKLASLSWYDNQKLENLFKQ